MDMYEVALIIAGLLVTAGVVGLVINLRRGQTTEVRRPLTIVGLVMGAVLEISYIDFLLGLSGVQWITGNGQRLLTSTTYLAVGVFLILKPYVNYREYSQQRRLGEIKNALDQMD